jgi:3-oxoacyl-[acyl-carrier protein] reductase/meso-butanediol dehydrogenase/(S,S)-butanediol dehydrogenase/diacetyl reductase
MKNTQKTVVITGGGRGIGEYISRAFLKEGYNLLIGSRNDTGLTNELGEGARFKKTDVRKLEDHRALAQQALEWTGRLDAYVNCAGFSRWCALSDIDECFWNEMIDTNLKGAFWGCKAAAESMKEQGCIINVSSLAGKRGSLNNSVYCISKFGVTGLTQSLAKELGVKGIRVNAVCPVYVKTQGLIEALKSKHSPAGGDDIESYLSEFARNNAALKRLPSGEEVANVCVFLASDQASAVTGQSINVDCGVLLQ